MLPRLLLILAVLCLPVAAQRKADKTTSDNKGAGGAPAVYPQEVKVMRGQSVVIELKGTTGSNKDMTFIIRDRPKLGRLKEDKPAMKTMLSATVTYIAAAEKKGDKDTFTFAAQVPGSSVCEPATVTIHILDTAVRLDTVDTLDLKKIVLGQPAERTFLIRNGGTALWEAKIPVPGGWKWLTPPDGAFKLEPGAEINARIACIADKVGNVEAVLELGPVNKVTLLARVMPPFTLLTAGAALVWQPDTRTRSGVIEVINHNTAQPLTISAAGPEWLKVEKSLTIPPDRKAPLALNVAKDHGKALTGKLKIAAGNYSEEVEVKAVPAPGVLTFVGGLDDRFGYGLHFGKLSAVTLTRAKLPFVVENEGGAPVIMKLQVPPYFRIEQPVPEEGVALAPGEQKTIVLLPPVDTAGTFKGQLVVNWGGGSQAVECSAGVEPSALPVSAGTLAGIRLEQTRPAGGWKIRSVEDQVREISAAGPGIFWSEGKEDLKLPRVNIVEIAEDTGEEVTFAWDLPKGDGWKFQLMRATVQRFSAGNYVKIWEPCGDEVKINIEGRRATALVKELHPHMPFNFRIQTIAPDGRRSMPGYPISYRPYPPDPTHWQTYRAFYAGGAALMVALGWWMWKRWKAPINAMA